MSDLQHILSSRYTQSWHCTHCDTHLLFLADSTWLQLTDWLTDWWLTDELTIQCWQWRTDTKMTVLFVSWMPIWEISPVTQITHSLTHSLWFVESVCVCVCRCWAMFKRCASSGCLCMMRECEWYPIQWRKGMRVGRCSTISGCEWRTAMQLHFRSLCSISVTLTNKGRERVSAEKHRAQWKLLIDFRCPNFQCVFLPILFNF